MNTCSRWSLVVILDIAPQTSRGFVQRFLVAQRDHGFHEALHALPRWQLFQRMALAGAGVPGRRVAIDKAGVDLVPAIRAHQPLIHLARGLLSVCLLYTSDAADEEDSVDLGGRRIIKK